MKYAQIRTLDISNGENVGIAIYLSGCRFHCKNCFNSELWDPEYGNEFTKDTMDTLRELLDKPYIKRITILGGEPFLEENRDGLFELVTAVAVEHPEKKIWIYSGYTWEQLQKDEKCSLILPYVDILVDGLFIDKLKDMKLKFKGSSNQRVIDVKQSLKEKRVIEYI